MIHLFHRYRFAAYSRLASGSVSVLYTCHCGARKIVTRRGDWHPLGNAS